ncbi:type II toxin-antitoxin system VapC family toxin [Nocardia sp. NPDC004068]|uniref:type II toxin-antitoxin system VapC family toxin n=1 Tax=Nocardia sp. NPDC004068 TaxID=3364303 RepID=UPI0036A10CF9
MSEPVGGQRILLDTSVIIDFEVVGKELAGEAAISVITLAELGAGVHATKDPVEQARRQFRLRWVEAALEPLPLDADAARAYGSLALLVEGMGRKPRKRFGDLLIAATAVANGLPLYTRNPDDFTGLEPFLNLVAV